MISRVHQSFRRSFSQLPSEIQERAREAYRKFALDPFHPSLRFKRVHASLPIWSARITDSYRAVGVRKGDNDIIWFFIGTHTEYEKLLRGL